MIIGAHLSTKEGFGKLPENALAMGLKTYQFFSKNQMQWKSSPMDPTQVKLHRENVKKYNIRSPSIHASYLINLGTPDEDKFRMSLGAFVDEINRAEQLGVELLIFHPGAHMGSGEGVALKRISDAMNSAIETTKGKKVVLTVENTAGQGSVVGYSLDHLAFLKDNVENSERIAFCIDTCHAFQAGYDLNGKFDPFMSELDEKIGFQYIRAFHLNDSKYPFNKHLDRHENLGKGYLSPTFYKNLFSFDKFENIPAFLETPGGEEGYPDDLKYLRSLGISL
jgi:deoxyribonuclease-4